MQPLTSPSNIDKRLRWQSVCISEVGGRMVDCDLRIVVEWSWKLTDGEVSTRAKVVLMEVWKEGEEKRPTPQKCGRIYIPGNFIFQM